MSLPFDFVKTRIQKMKPDVNGIMPYKGTWDCIVKVVVIVVLPIGDCILSDYENRRAHRLL